MITSIYIMVSCKLIVFLTNYGNIVAASGPPALKFTTSPGKNEVVTAILKQTDQLLANKFLPVWTINEDSPDTLQEQKTVMERVGPFIPYQDPETTVAAVVFQAQQKMRGIVDSRAIIERTPLNLEALSNPTFLATGVRHRTESRFFETQLPDYVSRVPEGFENGGSSGRKNFHDEYLNKKTEVTRLRRRAPNWNYIEILVLVNYDMVEELLTEPDDYSPIVSYVLTLFNNVDMLYAKISDLPIRLNLAGIVIGNSPKVFPLYGEGECNDKIEDSYGYLENDMDVRCTNKFITGFCDKHAKIIPPRTYDVAVLLTRYGLHQHEYNPRSGDRRLVRLGGLAESPKDGYYNRMKMGTMSTLVATISDRGEFESFPIIAHEMAHLFDVEHDEPTGEKHKLMQPNGKHSKKSLSWSRASMKSLKTFFESHHSCIFKNIPGSLRRPGPHKIWDAHRQCRCYGYKSAAIINMRSRLAGGFQGECDDNIQCADKFGNIHEGPVYWDGTPCGRKKVCWAGECVKVRK